MPKLPKGVKQGLVDVGALMGSVISDSELPDLDAGERLVNDAIRLNDFQDWLDETDAVSDDVKARVGEILDDAHRIFPAEPGKQLDYLTEAVNREALDDFAETGYDLSTVDELSVPLNPALPGDAEPPSTGGTPTAAEDPAVPATEAQTTPAASPETAHGAEAAPEAPQTGQPPSVKDDAPSAQRGASVSTPPQQAAALPAKTDAAPPAAAAGGAPQPTSAAGSPPGASETPPPETPPGEGPREPQPH
jgi:hypothetical protein